MKRQGCMVLKNKRKFFKNNKAVLGLPMRLTVTIIIGTAAMITILAFILNPCIFPDKMTVSIHPMVNKIPVGEDSGDFLIYVNVTDSEGDPISGANVMIIGLGGAGSNSTNKNGRTSVDITAWLQTGQNEGYLNIKVTRGCFETFSENNMIKVVRAWKSLLIIK